MKQELKKLMLSECRCVTYLPAQSQTAGNAEAESGAETREKGVSEEQLVKALTVNENLLTLGYTLNPADLVRIAQSPSLDTFYEDVRDLMGDVKAAPMYPDFPTQVMEMSEAQFRFHQILHYLSTYGVRELFGEDVKRGWLPYESEEKTEADTVLLEAKVLELLEEDKAAEVLAERILKRRERMTLPEQELVCYSLEEIAPEELEKLEVPFKENLYDIFGFAMGCLEKDQAFRVLRALCKHTGDVLKCAHKLLGTQKYHLHTSQKRFIVKLLEDYPVVDFKANLILSLKKARASLLVLKHLDYNIYSRSDAHKEAVRALRDGELHSWEGQARYLLENHGDGALEFVAARPGMMLRMVAWLLRLGYSAADIQEKLIANADALSTQTIVTTLNYFGTEGLYEQRIDGLKKKLVAETQKEPAGPKMKKILGKVEDREAHLREEIDGVCEILEAVLAKKLEQIETPLRGRKVYLDMEAYDLTHSVLRCNDKSEEGGYVRSGIAYRIPDEIQRLRFFVYWNDRQTVDVDLHAAAVTTEGKKVTVGWNSDYNDEGIVTSGDITHSDAAEYIDVDLSYPLKEVAFNINLFSGKDCFGDIETCFVGMMAVKKLGTEVKLYNPANCFFSHELRGKTETINYGYMDVVNRCLVFDGDESSGGYYDYQVHPEHRFNLRTYLDSLLKAQGAELAEDAEDADVILKMGKAETEKDVSFIDNNFFL